MITFFIIFTGLIATLMYGEGFLFSILAVQLAGPDSRLLKLCLLLVWPIATPILLFKLYQRYKDLLQNPMLGALTGLDLFNGSGDICCNEGASPHVRVGLEIPSFPLNENSFNPEFNDKETNQKEIQGNN